MPAIVESSWVLGPTGDDEVLEPFNADLGEEVAVGVVKAAELV